MSTDRIAKSAGATEQPRFKHVLGLPLVVLYGLGVTIGAGIYVLIGATGYIAVFVNSPQGLIVAPVVLAMGLAAAWSILESVALAGVLTLIEIGGLLLIVAAGINADPAILSRAVDAVSRRVRTAAENDNRRHLEN